MDHGSTLELWITVQILSDLLLKLTPNQDSLPSVPLLDPTMLPDTESAHNLPCFIRTRQATLSKNYSLQ